MKVFLTVHDKAVTPLEVFTRIATPLVEHPMGWRGLKVVDASASADSVVTLAPNIVIEELFPEEFAKKKLSVCNMKTKEVWLNEDRWRRALPDGSHLPLGAYRAYMVQHELGHALGHPHAETCATPGDPAPVMIQQTLGIGKCASNPFPTSHELADQ
jgi:hypothetical protein